LGKYLGREYRLRITRGEQPAVKLIAPFLIVSVPKLKGERAIRVLVQEWYARHARLIFTRRLACALRVQAAKESIDLLSAFGE
jgi:hypothetical protein